MLSKGTARVAQATRWSGAGAVALALGLWVASCGRTDVLRFDLSVPDASVDAGHDAGIDAGLDAGVDAGVDAGTKPCLEGRFPLTPAVPVVVLVLDSSGSMDEPFSGAASKWDALVSSLRQVLPAVDQTMQLGLLLFPVSRQQTCSSFVTPNPEPALGQVSTILSVLGSTEPAGGTPTADALQAATNSLLSRRTASSARALVLATDGVPNCNPALVPSTCFCLMLPCSSITCVDDDRSVLRVSNALDAGIPTYVIGIESPGQTFTGVLDRLAVAGGRPLPGAQPYYSASSAAELSTAFSTIRDQVARCAYLTSSVPNATGSIRVEVDGQVVPVDATGRSGWAWTDRPNGELVFLGSTCAQLIGGTQRLEAVVACGQN